MYSLFCSNYRRSLKRKLILKILRSIRHNTFKLKLNLWLRYLKVSHSVTEAPVGEFLYPAHRANWGHNWGCHASPLSLRRELLSSRRHQALQQREGESTGQSPCSSIFTQGEWGAQSSSVSHITPLSRPFPPRAEPAAQCTKCESSLSSWKWKKVVGWN